MAFKLFNMEFAPITKERYGLEEWRCLRASTLLHTTAQPASPSYLSLPQSQIFLTYELLTYERVFCFSMLSCRLDGPQNHIVEREGLTHEALAVPLTGNSPVEVMAFAETQRK
jgi:hypothetical protein